MEETGNGGFTPKDSDSMSFSCTCLHWTAPPAPARGDCVSSHNPSRRMGCLHQVEGGSRCAQGMDGLAVPSTERRLKAPRSLPLCPQLLRDWAWTAPPCLFTLPPPFSKHSTFSFCSLDLGRSRFLCSFNCP